MSDSIHKIMIIDDDPFMIRAIELCLKKKGYEICTAKTAEDALEIIKEQDFDFFLVDLVLPGMHGFDFVKTIKKNIKYVQTPILIITARMESSDKRTALSIGANGIFVKPFDLEELASKIQNILSNY